MLKQSKSELVDTDCGIRMCLLTLKITFLHWYSFSVVHTVCCCCLTDYCQKSFIPIVRVTCAKTYSACCGMLCRYKDGVELRSGGKYRVVEDDDKVQLIVRGVEKDDAGDITCELSNSKGKESATAKLRAQCKHSTPQRYCQRRGVDPGGEGRHSTCSCGGGARLSLSLVCLSVCLSVRPSVRPSVSLRFNGHFSR